MEAIEHDMQDTTWEFNKQRNTLNFTTSEIYKAIDLNSNIFESEVEGKITTYLSPDLGNPVYLIQDFVEKIAKGKKAFSKELDKYRPMKNLALAKYYPLTNAFLSSYLPDKVYSPHVAVFFEIFIIKYRLAPEVFQTNPNDYSELFKQKYGEFFNKLIEEILVITSQRAFKRKLYARMEAINRGYLSSKGYLKALHERYARLLVMRIDFGFRTEDPLLPHTVGLAEAQTQLGRFLNNKRGKKLYANLVGYIWRLEYGRQKGYHFHFFFFFDGSKSHKDEYLANQIGLDWIKITNEKGLYHNCNADKQRYKRLGIGMISHDDLEKREILLEVLGYMHKEDQTLREKHTDKTHTWGRGTTPQIPESSLGRRRRCVTSNQTQETQKNGHGAISPQSLLGTVPAKRQRC